MMEINTQHVELPRESTINIGGTRFIVTAHFDDTREQLQPKIARLLQNYVEQQDSHI